MSDRPVAAVLGLGLVGASLALAIRQTGTFESVVGWDPDFDTAREAKRLKVADRFAGSAPEAARTASLALIALRGEAFAETMLAVGPHLRSGAVACSVLELHETASVQAAKSMPASVSFLMADAIPWEALPETPSAQLFQKGIWCLSPLPTAHENAVAYVAQLGERMGMTPYFVDAREHDALATGLHTLPSVLAAALMRVATRQPSWREMSRLAGAPFREATAPVAAGAADQQRAMAGGREHLVRWLDTTIRELAVLKDGLQDGQEPADYFEGALEARAKWLADREIPPEAAELPRTEDPVRRRFHF